MRRFSSLLLATCSLSACITAPPIPAPLPPSEDGHDDMVPERLTLGFGMTVDFEATPIVIDGQATTTAVAQYRNFYGLGIPALALRWAFRPRCDFGIDLNIGRQIAEARCGVVSQHGFGAALTAGATLLPWGGFGGLAHTRLDLGISGSYGFFQISGGLEAGHRADMFIFVPRRGPPAGLGAGPPPRVPIRYNTASGIVGATIGADLPESGGLQLMISVGYRDTLWSSAARLGSCLDCRTRHTFGEVRPQHEEMLAFIGFTGTL